MTMSTSLAVIACPTTGETTKPTRTTGTTSARGNRFQLLYPRKDSNVGFGLDRRCELSDHPLLGATGPAGTAGGPDLHHTQRCAAEARRDPLSRSALRRPRRT